MKENNERQEQGLEEWVEQIDQLADEVKMLALNLAINLAKSKKEIKELSFMEPEFTKLINGSVEVVKEIAGVMRAFKNEEKLVYSPRKNSQSLDRIETTLNEIHSLSRKVLYTISEIKQSKNQLRNYK
ncbi:MAG: hypothetical protein DRP46_14095 [Candidatus Zixiibacteriota bacterium]|nr:MAG: hypothetical protein DRP46_14095 [candidate division Zixibacteria bacterium]HDL03000.1 hypothetical protein [candidate division Zixibacteria bacterium]